MDRVETFAYDAATAVWIGSDIASLGILYHTLLPYFKEAVEEDKVTKIVKKVSILAQLHSLNRLTDMGNDHILMNMFREKINKLIELTAGEEDK